MKIISVCKKCLDQLKELSFDFPYNYKSYMTGFQCDMCLQTTYGFYEISEVTWELIKASQAKESDKQ